MSEIADDPELYCAFTIQPGQLQFVNNHTFGHGRTAYRDPEDKALGRHMLRLWHREWGRRSYSG
ncbi:MAG: TauD/TfdA family dioxygenase, partial [SAR324 cluster bacterium]|nr:TauD/TfdA family dioxygenase [SAR324 cluster bacterium]